MPGTVGLCLHQKKSVTRENSQAIPGATILSAQLRSITSNRRQKLRRPSHMLYGGTAKLIRTVCIGKQGHELTC